MTEKDDLRKEFILDNPNLNATETLEKLKKKGLGKRKTDFLKEFREIRKIPEPTKEKKEKSIPKKFRKLPTKPKKVKPTPKEKKKPKELTDKEKEKQEKEIAEGIEFAQEIDKPKEFGQYGVIEVIDKQDNSFWIKYTDDKDFKRQLEKLKPSLQSDSITFVNHGFRKYISFIEKDFEKILITEGIQT